MWRNDRYGLAHPDALAVYAARWLLGFEFGQDLKFLDGLDGLYSQTQALLHLVTSEGPRGSMLSQGSSLESFDYFWGRVCELVDTAGTPGVKAQLSLLERFVTEEWNLRCAWAPYAILRELGDKHQMLINTEEARPLNPTLPPYVPHYVPHWGGEAIGISTGFLSPQTGGHVADVMVNNSGEIVFVKIFSNVPPMHHRGRYEPGDMEVDRALSVNTEISWEDRGQIMRAVRRRDPKFQKARQYFLTRGWVEARDYQDLDRTIHWLYLRLSTREGWKDLAKIINEQEKPKKPHTFTNIATHCNRLSKLLMIEPLPDRPPRFG